MTKVLSMVIILKLYLLICNHLYQTINNIQFLSAFEKGVLFATCCLGVFCISVKCKIFSKIEGFFRNEETIKMPSSF